MEEEKKEDPTFFYNENKEPDPDMKGHFFITQIQTLIIAIFITAMMQISNHLALYLIYCCPMYFFLVLIQYFAFWKPEADLTTWYNIYNIVMFVICVPIFFGVFFGVFHPTASVEFTQVQNCQLIGVQTKWIEQTEKYSIFYVNFEHGGKQYLGSACASDFSEESTTAPILPYKFYYKYDGVAQVITVSMNSKCGSNTNNTDLQYQYHRLLSQNHLNSTELNSKDRILRTGGGGRSGGGGHSGGHSGGSHSHSSSSSSSSSGSRSSSSSCYRDYLWSKVKIASWLCQDRDFDEEDLMEPQSCYVSFFSGDKAVQNGLNRAPMRDEYDIPIVAYQKHAYFPKIDLVCLILFSYYNWILSFNSIFQYTANYFLRILRKITQKKLLDCQNEEQKFGQNSVQRLKTSQNQSNFESNLDQSNNQNNDNSINNNNDTQPQQLIKPMLENENKNNQSLAKQENQITYL